MGGGWRALPTPPRNPWGGYLPNKFGNMPRLMERIPTVSHPPKPPSPVDLWISQHRSSNVEESQSHDSVDDFVGMSLDYLLNSDMVECQLSVLVNPGEIEGPFQDPTSYTLHLTIHVPPTIGFLVYFCTSPTVVFETYTECQGDREPDWINIRKPIVFHRPRAQMVEVLAFLARDNNNQEVAEAVLDWCHEMTLSNQSTSLSNREPTSPRKTTVPNNIRPHKDRSVRPQISYSQLKGLRCCWTPSRLD
ncbi:hypothetical protein BDN70DRAFT_936703 [Pholiota conissans]|uniref:Uncharacterized protein n=1 Tax=Pholiota conissans TaxID=109636 RepID=A0A9P5YR85_9AGAR|nr:hypothetical protein BDN70DRAFT_936703 [Pholiota conissans]